MTVLAAHPTDSPVMSDLAKVIFRKLNQRREKTEIPIKPIISEFFGLAKAGKDRQLVEMDRWFKRRKYNVTIYQESAENEKIRRMARADAYTYEMAHFAYTFGNLVTATTSRDLHLAVQNRGVIDTLCWLQWHRGQGNITQDQNEHARAFMLGGPWVEAIDAVFYLTCEVQTSLEREYGKSRNIVYGSRMNPKFLNEMKNAIEAVYDFVGETVPNLPLFKIDTTQKGIDETRDEIISLLLQSVEKRLSITEEDILPWSTALMREMANNRGQEIKFKGLVSDRALRDKSWHLESVSTERDLYLKPKSQLALANDECFHVRYFGSGDKCHLIYKRGGGATAKFRLNVPLRTEDVEGLISEFEKIGDIKKEREVFIKNGSVLTRDKVEGLGEFTEIRSADTDVLETARELGLDSEDVVPDTYIRLYLKNQSA